MSGEVREARGKTRDVLRTIRGAGAGLVENLHQVVKAIVDAPDDELAATSAVASTLMAIAVLADAVKGDVALSFIRGDVYVCGQILCAPRATYAAAIELGVWLGDEGVAELSFATGHPDREGRAQPAVTDVALLALGKALAAAIRDPMRRGAVSLSTLPGVTTRPANPLLERDDTADDAEPREQVLRAYATALVVMRRFYESVATGPPVAAHRVKRLAQEIVVLFAGGDPALLGMTTFAGAYGDDAGRAVHAALIAVAVARQLSADALALARVALAALMADVGRAFLFGVDPEQRLLNEEDTRALKEMTEMMEEGVAAVSTAICVAAGGLNLTNALRTVVVYETTWRERQASLGPLYHNRLHPLLQTEILQLVRAYLNRIAPRVDVPAGTPMSSIEALADLTSQPWVDPAVFRLLVRALGVFPTGTVVELETGEWAVALCSSANPDALDRPRVRLVTEPSGRACTVPRDIDLGAPGGGWVPSITRVVGPAEVQFNVARVFVGPVG